MSPLANRIEGSLVPFGVSALPLSPSTSCVSTAIVVTSRVVFVGV